MHRPNQIRGAHACMAHQSTTYPAIAICDQPVASDPVVSDRRSLRCNYVDKDGDQIYPVHPTTAMWLKERGNLKIFKRPSSLPSHHWSQLRSVKSWETRRERTSSSRRPAGPDPFLSLAGTPFNRNGTARYNQRTSSVRSCKELTGAPVRRDDRL